MAPEIDGDIKSLQVEMGALFSDEGLASTFQNKAKALQALESGVVLLDRSHWGRFRLAGKDRLLFLHNLSTASFTSARPGEGKDTVFVTPTARCLDIGTVLVNETGCLVIVSPSMKDELRQRIDKYTFPGDDVQVMDLGSRTAMVSLLGPDSTNVLKELAGDAFTLAGKPYGSHQVLGFRARAPLIVMVGSGLSIPGYTIITDETVAGDLYAVLAGKGAIPLGEDDWDAARILDGRPMPGRELTADYTPLEAGLCHMVSLSKGCYIGQETLAKVALHDGVKQQLWGLELAGPMQPGAPIYSEMSKVGVVTSTCQDAEGAWMGLGYIRCRVGGVQIDLDGVQVAVDGTPARVRALPFATRTFPEGQGPSRPGSSSSTQDDASAGHTISDRAAQAKQALAEEKAVAEAAKAARIKAMEERMAAWKAQQVLTSTAPPNS